MNNVHVCPPDRQDCAVCESAAEHASCNCTADETGGIVIDPACIEHGAAERLAVAS